MAERLTDADFRTAVRMSLGDPLQTTVTDEDIDVIRKTINRHGYDDSRRAADILWHLLEGPS